MDALTVNAIFDLLKERRALVNPEKGGCRFDRHERVESVFPERLCKEISSRSLSYYSWFLNMDKQAVPVRDLLRRLYAEDSYGVVQEMVDKCSRLLGGRGEKQKLDRQIWKDLLDLAGREIPLFVRGSDGSKKLQQMAETCPERALTCLFLAAGMEGLTPVQYEQMENSWRLLNRVFLSGVPDSGEELEEPVRRMQAGELLLLDGNREEALHQFEQAAEKLREEIRNCETQDDAPDPQEKRDAQDSSLEKKQNMVPRVAAIGQTSAIKTAAERRKTLGRILLRLGNLYMYEGAEGPGRESRDLAIRVLHESAELGQTQAYESLAILELQNGAHEEARETLLQGARAGVPACLRMLGNAFYRGDEIANGRRDLHRAVRFYLQGACREDPASGDNICQYMLGRILEKTSREDVKKERITERPEEKEDKKEIKEKEEIKEKDKMYRADASFLPEDLTGPERDPAYWYAAAARLGNTDAAACLNRLRWHTFGEEEIRAGSRKPPRGLPAGRQICLLNSRAERNLGFAGTLPKWTFSVLVCSGLPEEYDPGAHLPGEMTGEDPGAGAAAGSGSGKRAQTVSGDIAGISRETLPQALFRIGMQYLEEAKARSALSKDFDPAQWLEDTFPEILCAALDDDEQKNIRDGLRTLQAAYLLHDHCSVFARGKDREEDTDLFYLLSKRVKLFVAGSEKSAAPVFDSAFSRMVDFYIPLYLCDPQKMASTWLLDRLPMFIPCLEKGRRRDKKQMNITVFGDHPGIVQLCRDILAVAQIEDGARFPFSLTIVGEGADLLEEELLTECPGIADPPEGSVVKAPLFISMKPESRAFQQLLSMHPAQKGNEEDQQTADRLQGAEYLIVYTREESRNLSLAMYLREWYLKTDPTFTRLPFIAAYCEKPVLAEQMRTLTAGAEEAGFGWYNNYRIEPFGTQAQLFSYEALVNSRLEQRALASHLAYYSFTTWEDRFRAEHDYFCRNYNRDSSVLNALALPYRLFSAGITFADWHDYPEGVSQKRLAQQFERWLKEEDPDGSRKIAGMQQERGEGPQTGEGIKNGNKMEEGNKRLERMAAYEHGRWNRAMLSRGWMPASVSQMLTYIQRGNARQQLYIAKLHPFLCSWEQLGQRGEIPGGIQREYDAIMRQIRPDRTPADIRQIDRENVLRTAQILRSAP